MQPLEQSTPSLPIMGNKPVTNVPLSEENNNNEINHGNETVSILLPHINDIEFGIPNVQVPLSNSEEKVYYIIDSQKCNLIQIIMITIFQLFQW